MPKRRRRSFTPQFKAQVVLEVLSGLRSQAEVARQHKLKPELMARWKDIALEGLEGLFQGEEQRNQDQDRIAELERMVGRLTMELEVAKKASALLPSALRLRRNNNVDPWKIRHSDPLPCLDLIRYRLRHGLRWLLLSHFPELPLDPQFVHSG